MAASKTKVSRIEFIVTFVALFFLTNLLFKTFFPTQDTSKPTVTLTMEASKVREGNNPIVIINNKTEKDLSLPKGCPQPAVDITYIQKTGDTEERMDLIPNESVLPCEDITIVKAGESVRVSLAGWKYALFDRTGSYEANLSLPENFAEGNPDHRAVVSFSIVEPGTVTKIFRTFVSKPLLNTLLFIASWVPNHNLGITIILLTILIKVLLLLPNQHALEGQRKLQLLQPRMEEIKRKYPGDATRVQEETMKLWKELKINPLQSCLPTLLQLPILIGLFYVIRDGISIETSKHLLYSFYNDLPPQYLDHMFFGFDLLLPSIYIMPPLLVILQFAQMKMMMSKKKPADEIVVKPAGKKSWIPEMDQQTVMMYILPFMIGFFALQFPAAVSLYWGISTLFGIAQQWYVMHEKLKV